MQLKSVEVSRWDLFFCIHSVFLSCTFPIPFYNILPLMAYMKPVGARRCLCLIYIGISWMQSCLSTFFARHWGETIAAVAWTGASRRTIW